MAIVKMRLPFPTEYYQHQKRRRRWRKKKRKKQIVGHPSHRASFLLANKNLEPALGGGHSPLRSLSVFWELYCGSQQGRETPPGQLAWDSRQPLFSLSAVPRLLLGAVGSSFQLRAHCRAKVKANPPALTGS